MTVRNQRHITVYSAIWFLTFHDIVHVLRLWLFIVILPSCCDTDMFLFVGQIKEFFIKLKQIGMKQKSSFLMCEITLWGDNETTGCDVMDTTWLWNFILPESRMNSLFLDLRSEPRQTSCSYLKTRLLLMRWFAHFYCHCQIFQVLMWQTLSHHLIHTPVTVVWSAADTVSL